MGRLAIPWGGRPVGCAGFESRCSLFFNHQPEQNSWDG